MTWDFLKKGYAFHDAIKALKEGKRIRRKSEKKGYTKTRGESFETYWVDDGKTCRYCMFTLDDVFADDWMIDS